MMAASSMQNACLSAVVCVDCSCNEAGAGGTRRRLGPSHIIHGQPSCPCTLHLVMYTVTPSVMYSVKYSMIASATLCMSRMPPLPPPHPRAVPDSVQCSKDLPCDVAYYLLPHVCFISCHHPRQTIVRAVLHHVLLSVLSGRRCLCDDRQPVPAGATGDCCCYSSRC